jgi:hypothetical protein
MKLRQEAGRQMMRELKGALDKTDQDALAKLVRKAADVIMADRERRRAEGGHAAPWGGLGAPGA